MIKEMLKCLKYDRQHALTEILLKDEIGEPFSRRETNCA